MSSSANIEACVYINKAGPHCVVFCFRSKDDGVDLIMEDIVDVLLDVVLTPRLIIFFMKGASCNCQRWRCHCVADGMYFFSVVLTETDQEGVTV